MTKDRHAFARMHTLCGSGGHAHEFTRVAEVGAAGASDGEEFRSKVSHPRLLSSVSRSLQSLNDTISKQPLPPLDVGDG